MSKDALEQARVKLPDATFHRTSMEDAPIAPASQDCVMMIAVLEHLKSPQDALARIHTWLDDGGLVMIQVPYVAPFIKAKRWIPWLPIHFEAPRHLFDFSPSTMKRYLREAGYTDIHIEISRPYSSPTALGAALIWAVKLVGYTFYYATGRRYVYPFSGAILASAVKRAPIDS